MLQKLQNKQETKKGELHKLGNLKTKSVKNWREGKDLTSQTIMAS